MRLVTMANKDKEENKKHLPKRSVVVSLSWYLGVGALLFAISVVGIFLNRKELHRAADGD